MLRVLVKQALSLDWASVRCHLFRVELGRCSVRARALLSTPWSLAVPGLWEDPLCAQALSQLWLNRSPVFPGRRRVCAQGRAASGDECCRVLPDPLRCVLEIIARESHQVALGLDVGPASPWTASEEPPVAGSWSSELALRARTSKHRPSPDVHA